MDKGNYVVDFEYHYQMREFLALSKSKVSNQMHHLHNRQRPLIAS